MAEGFVVFHELDSVAVSPIGGEVELFGIGKGERAGVVNFAEAEGGFDDGATGVAREVGGDEDVTFVVNFGAVVADGVAGFAAESHDAGHGEVVVGFLAFDVVALEVFGGVVIATHGGGERSGVLDGSANGDDAVDGLAEGFFRDEGAGDFLAVDGFDLVDFFDFAEFAELADFFLADGDVVVAGGDGGEVEVFFDGELSTGAAGDLVGGGDAGF